MKTSLANTPNEELNRQITQEFIASKAFRERLIAVLDGKRASLRKDTIARTSYDSPSWAYVQADNNGYERAISEVISLLS